MENFNLKCEQLKNYICDGINQVALPPYAVELILENLLRDVREIRKSAMEQEAQKARDAGETITKEEAPVEKTNEASVEG